MRDLSNLVSNQLGDVYLMIANNCQRYYYNINKMEINFTDNSIDLVNQDSVIIARCRKKELRNKLGEINYA